MQTGVNAFELYENFNNVQAVQIATADGEHEFACVQLHNTLMGRGDIVKETTLEVFNTEDKKYWNPMPQVSKNHLEFDVPPLRWICGKNLIVLLGITLTFLLI